MDGKYFIMCGLAATLGKLDRAKNKELDDVESNLTNINDSKNNVWKRKSTGDIRGVM